MKKNLLTGNNRNVCSFLLLVLFTAPIVSFAQVKFSAVCQDNKIGINELLEIQYVVENASSVDEIVPPAFKNFSTVSGPNHQSSASMINGNISQSVAIDFVLKPNAAGSFTIPPAVAKVNGKILYSNKLSVQVTNSTSVTSHRGGAAVSPFSSMLNDPFTAPSMHEYDDYILHKGENVNEKVKKNLFVKVDVNKTSCYVGEPVVATYKLYTRLKSESNLTRTPSFNGFSVSEMKVPDTYTTATERYNGREYNVYTLRKVQLYPLQPGNIELDPVEVENHITFIKAEYASGRSGGIFDDMMRDFAIAATPAEGIEEQKIMLQSKPVNILVKALPEINKPKDFKGAVGSFSLQVAVEKSDITTDEAGNLSVTVSGRGNMQMVNAPVIYWPPGIEAFDPRITENVDNTAVPLKGQKTFSFPFTVSDPGKCEIAPVSFSYFDISTHSYKTTLTTPVTINVRKGTGNGRTIAAQSNIPVISQPNVDNNKEIKRFIILAAIAFCVAGFFIWLTIPGKKVNVSAISGNEDAGDEGMQPTPKELILPRKDPLQEAEQMLLDNNTQHFYQALNNGVKRYLSSKFQFPEKELTRKKISELLDTHQVSVGTTLKLSALTEDIELHLYSPASSPDQLQKVYETAGEVIALLEKQINDGAIQ